MLCTEFPCGFHSPDWKEMRMHYKTLHPEVQRPDKYFTKEARKTKKEEGLRGKKEWKFGVKDAKKLVIQ